MSNAGKFLTLVERSDITVIIAPYHMDPIACYEETQGVL